METNETQTSPETQEPPATQGQEGPQNPQGTQSEADEKIEVSKKEFESLVSLKARQTELTKREQRVKNREEKISKGRQAKASDPNAMFTFEQPKVEEPSEDEARLEDEREYSRLKMSISDLLLDNDDLRDVVNKDATLKRILKNNPLALLDDTPIDAQDALEQIEDLIKERIKPDKKEGPNNSAPQAQTEAPKPAPQQPGTKTPEEKKPMNSFSDVEKSIAASLNISGV